MMTQIKKLELHSTATICDAMDKLDLPGYIPDILPLGSHTGTVAGLVHTTLFVPISDERPALADNHIDALANYDLADPEHVIALVQAPPGSFGAIIGGLKVQRCMQIGVKALFTNGRIRDYNEILESEFTVFCANQCRTSLSAKGLMKCVELCGALQFGDVVVKHGDFIVGDCDGVVCIPRDFVEAVIELCEELVLEEDMCMNDLVTGATLEQVFKEYR